MSFSLPTFPTLTAGFPVMKKPAFSTRIQRGISGREVRVADQSTPIWEFVLTYEILRDGHDSRSATGPWFGYSEWRTLAGFYLQQQGPFLPFLYDDPTDNIVVGGAIGTGNGTQTIFPIVRQLVPGGFSEPIPTAIADGSKSFNVYLNGVSQPNPAAWIANSSLGYTGIADEIVFVSPPGVGVAITADFSFFYYCRFSEDNIDFSYFLLHRWEAKSVKFRSIID